MMNRLLGVGKMAKQFNFNDLFASNLLCALAKQHTNNQYIFVDIENYQMPLPSKFATDKMTTFTFASAAKASLRQKLSNVATKTVKSDCVHFHTVPAGPDAADVDLIMLCSQLHLLATLLGRDNDVWIIMSNDHIFKPLATMLHQQGREVHLLHSQGNQVCELDLSVEKRVPTDISPVEVVKL
jgi:hypothetical protein